MKRRDSDHDEELINAVAEYLEIVENGEDPTEFLASLGPCAVQVRQIAGVESLLRLSVDVPAPSEIARGRSSLLMSITAEERRLRQTGPKLFGIFAAAGLGLALGAGFASGAVPTEQLNNLTENLPFIGVEASREKPDGSKDEDERDFESNQPAWGASPQVDNEDESISDGSSLEAPQPALNIIESKPARRREQWNGSSGSGLGSVGPATANGVGSGSTPTGQGGETPGAGDDSGVGNDETPPIQGDASPGADVDYGVGSDGTPPGLGGANPGNGVGTDATPLVPGGANPSNEVTLPPRAGGNPGNGVGSDATPPAQGGDNRGNGSGGN